ncbi:non-specific lipid transfer protein GPI-anchored 1-like [Canna indica]|uniref:Non-specific lipid transfer protein GPI-anchored 1-like n=1 Tax=Canna indica TaxID=4628 RepID=A0AAQ3JV18_9LILI|nr:non-specific lipid transfer protein GPI-anchored 1-like [Canna indica]
MSFRYLPLMSTCLAVLLNLSPSSPDYAIFMNTTKATNSSNGAANVTPASSGFRDQVYIVSTVIIALIPAIFFFIFSIGA